VTTRFTELVGCRLPLQLAGMGGVGTAVLARAVADAGGLGMASAAGSADPAALADSLGDGAVGLNFLMPFLDRSAVEVVSSRVRVVEFFWADPDSSLVDIVHQGGALAAWQIGTVDDARAAAEAGCDLVVAQGVEAGGHVCSTIGLLPLLAGVLDAVEVPVVASGGIGTARAVKAVLAAGADAVRVGTRFVAAQESNAHPDYVAALIKAEPEDTILTVDFGVGWPDAPHRVLSDSLDAAKALPADTPWRLIPPPPTRDTPAEMVGAMAQYAGESVGAVHGNQTVAEIVAELFP
jgi:nitronate monooxygenase